MLKKSSTLYPIEQNMEEPILALLKDGPRTISDLLKAGDYNPRILYKRLNLLLAEGRILEFPFKRGNRWLALYCLPRHKEAAQQMSGRPPEPPAQPRSQERWRRASSGSTTSSRLIQPIPGIEVVTY